MSLTTLWKDSKTQLEGKHIQQIIAFAGEGQLNDENSASAEFREFIANIPSSLLKEYANQCLEDKFHDSGFALQDLINQVGVRLGFEVEHGRYRGTTKYVGHDGLWILPDGHAIVVEVKTTDAYRIDLNRIAGYRKELVMHQRISEERSSLLIVVGRKDTGDLEAQIRGSRHAWDIRLISVDALLRLMSLKEELEDPRTILRIHNILIPREFTKLDEIVDILFSATEEAKQEDVTLEAGEEADEGQEPQTRDSPKAFHGACVARVETHLNTTLVRRVKTGYSSADGSTALICVVSKEYNRSGHPSFWFAFHPHQREFLEKAEQGFLALGCGSEENILLVPLSNVKQWLNDLWTTDRDGRTYWHIRVHHEDGAWLLDRKEGKGRLGITKYLLH
jgi:hypothetical protein